MAKLIKKLFISIMLIPTHMILAQKFEGVIVLKESSMPSSQWLDVDLLEQRSTEIDSEIALLKKNMLNLDIDERHYALERLISLEQEKLGIKAEVEETVYTYSLKKGLFRSESSHGEVVIMRFDKKVMWSLVPFNKAYMEIEIDEALLVPRVQKDSSCDTEQVYGGSPPVVEENVEIQKTGVTRIINGFPCDQILIMRGLEEAEYWITRKFTVQELYGDNWRIMMSRGEGENVVDWIDLTILNGVPILAITRTIDNEIHVEILSIREKSIPESLFEIPEGYRKMSLEQLLEEEMGKRD